MNLIQGANQIECIAKEQFDNFSEAVEKTKMLRDGKKTVIFGAGIMGMQLAYTIRKFGIVDYLFCDNDKNKWGTTVCDALVLAPESIAGKSDQFFVFIAIERYDGCMQQLEMLGYHQNKGCYNLKNCSETQLLQDFQQDLDASVLVMGDCIASNISIEDEFKLSIKDLLYRKSKIKILAMNGTYMRLYYNLFMMSLKKMEKIETLVVLSNMDVFGSKYHLFSKNQHEKVFDELCMDCRDVDAEMKEFQKVQKKRARNSGIFDYTSPNRDATLSENKIEQGRRLHMKLNYLYELDEHSESMQYLDRLCKECKDHNINMIYVMLPVNWQAGERYFEKSFFRTYNALKDAIYFHIVENGGKVLDLSYFLEEEDFISLRSTNEGIRENGRKSVARIILNELGESRNELAN